MARVQVGTTVKKTGLQMDEEKIKKEVEKNEKKVEYRLTLASLAQRDCGEKDQGYKHRLVYCVCAHNTYSLIYTH